MIRKARLYDRPGFTLLEVMIALAFIGVALLAIVRAQGQGIKLTEQARLTSQTVYLARQILAETQFLSGLTEGVEQGTFEEPLDYLAWERRVVPLEAIPASGFYRVTVSVHRTGRPAHEGVSLEGFAYAGGS